MIHRFSLKKTHYRLLLQDSLRSRTTLLTTSKLQRTVKMQPRIPKQNICLRYDSTFQARENIKKDKKVDHPLKKFLQKSPLSPKSHLGSATTRKDDFIIPALKNSSTSSVTTTPPTKPLLHLFPPLFTS